MESQQQHQSQSPEMLTVLSELQRLRDRVDFLSAQLAALRPTRLKQFGRPAPRGSLADLPTLPLMQTIPRKQGSGIDKVVVYVESNGVHTQVFDKLGHIIPEFCGEFADVSRKIFAEPNSFTWETRYPSSN